jgi:hypothetical protein
MAAPNNATKEMTVERALYQVETETKGERDHFTVLAANRDEARSEAERALYCVTSERYSGAATIVSVDLAGALSA